MRKNSIITTILISFFAIPLGCSEGDDGRSSGLSASDSSVPGVTTAQATTVVPTTDGDEMGEGDTTTFPTTGGLGSDGCLPDPSAGVRCNGASDSQTGSTSDPTASGGESQGHDSNSCHAGDTATITFTVPYLEVLGDGEGTGKPEITWWLWASRSAWGDGNSGPDCTFHKQDPYYETSGPSQVVIQKSCKFEILLDPDKEWNGLSTDIGFWAEEYGGLGDTTKKVEGNARVGFDWNMMNWTTQALGGEGDYWIDGVNENFKMRIHFSWAVECVKP